MTISSSTPVAGLTPEAARRISHTATAVVILVGLTSAALSWEGLHRLALNAGIDPRLAWGLPVIVDGTVVAGLLGVLAGTLAGTGTRYPWCLVLLGASASIAGNVAAAPGTTVGRTVAVAAPVCLALTLEQGLRVLRHRAGLPAPRTRRQRTPAPVAPVATTAMTSTAPAPAAPARRARPAASTAVASSRPSARRDQVAALVAVQPEITGAEAARTLGIDPADARRHLRALRTGQQPARATLTLAATGGA